MRGRAAELELIMADGPSFPRKGQMIIADRAVDLKTGTLSLVAEFPNPKALMRPGQFGRVRLAATVAENALLVPAEGRHRDSEHEGGLRRRCRQQGGRSAASRSATASGRTTSSPKA